MSLTGTLYIGATAAPGSAPAFHATNPATGEQIGPAFAGAGPGDVARACQLAAAAFTPLRQMAGQDRAAFLEQIAANIIALGPVLIERAVLETGLPPARLEGERGRTVNQLRLFAQLLRDGQWERRLAEPAQPERTPLPKPALAVRRIGVGPVAVFGASNFPLAFSVAGGDTAAALAAGCPVVVKGHPAHPGTGELVGLAVRQAVVQCGLHEGVFTLLAGADHALGAALVADPHIKAVGFTGSRAGGMALMRLAAARPEPIPVYAEMSSINPVLLMPAALAARGPAIAAGFVASLTMGAGQFCTNPGLLLGVAGPALDAFIDAADSALAQAGAATMLTPGIHAAYQDAMAERTAHPSVRGQARGQAGSGPHQCQPVLLRVDAADFLAHPLWQQEVFGASALLVACPDLASVRRVLAQLEGQLTATVQVDEADYPQARALLPLLEEMVGRILVNGFPTGVEVSAAMVHGGPFPATSDARMSSVGTIAIERFLRPVCYQDMPAAMLP